MIVRRALKIRKQLVTEESWMVVKTVTVLTQSASDITPGIQLSDKCDPSGGFGRLPASAGRALGSRAIPQAKPRTSETPNTSPPPGPCRGTKKRPCARWIRMPDRGSLWLLPSGPDQIRNMSSSEPIERARRLIYITCSRPAEQDAPRSKGKPHECTAAKWRGRKYATAPHQLLRREPSSGA